MSIKEISPYKTSMSDIATYLQGNVPFARVVHDKAAIQTLGQMKGHVVELGASVYDYSMYAISAEKYIRTNLNAFDRGIEVLDATDMPYASDTIDGFVCMSVLEHIYDYKKVISEVYRCLKPGGKFLLITPWVFPFHGAPDDYFRFSPSALGNELSQFGSVSIEPVGGYWVNMAMLLQRPVWRQGHKVLPLSIGAVMRRFIGCCFLLTDKIIDSKYNEYAMLFATLAVKKVDSKHQ